MRKLLLLLLLSTGCQKSQEKVPPFTSQVFNGRDEIIAYCQTIRQPVYQATVPRHWKRIDPPAKESLSDITKPIVTFIIDEHVTLTIHTFPTNSLDERIPATVQVERWRTQVPGQSHIEKAEHGGFTGLYFEGGNEKVAVYAWSLQLDLDHYQYLHFLAATVEEEEHYKQMAADYTIKVSGPTPLIDKHRNEIFLFANSFELIQELPTRT